MEKSFNLLVQTSESVDDTVKPLQSRRTFLKRLGLATAGVAVTSPEQLLAQTKQTELSPRAVLKEITKFISKHREQVDYAKIWAQNTPVLFIGERHTVMSDKNEVIKNLDLLKRLGLTHVAMEMLREEHQAIVDAYFSGKIDKQKVLEIFKDGWDEGPGIPEKYMELVDAIKTTGLKLLAVDLYTAGPEYDTEAFFKRRNENWARIIGEVIKQSPKARVLVYNGQSHSGYNMVDDSANEILKNVYNIQTTTAEFAGGEIAHDNFFFSDKIGKAAQTLKIGKTKFGLPVAPTAETREAVYMIHLPQTERK